VAEIENVTLGSVSRIRFATLVFPAPEGDEIINKVPSEDNKLEFIQLNNPIFLCILDNLAYTSFIFT
jgi:hypothetical protein